MAASKSGWPCDECPQKTPTFIETPNYSESVKKADEFPIVILHGTSGSGRKTTARHIIIKKWEENSRWHELTVKKCRESPDFLNEVLADYGAPRVVPHGDLHFGALLRKSFRSLENQGNDFHKFFIIDLSKLGREDVNKVLLALDEFCRELSATAHKHWTILVPVTVERHSTHHNRYVYSICHNFKEFDANQIRMLIKAHFPHNEPLQELAEEIKENFKLQGGAHAAILCLIVCQLDAKEPDQSMEQFLNQFFTVPEERQGHPGTYAHRVDVVCHAIIERIISKNPEDGKYYERVIMMMSFLHRSGIPRDLLCAFLFMHEDFREDKIYGHVKNLLVKLNKAHMIKGLGEEDLPQSPYTVKTVVLHSVELLRNDLTLISQVELAIDAMVALVTFMPKKGHMYDYQQNKSYIAQGKTLLDKVDKLLLNVCADNKVGLRLLSSHLACRVALAMMIDNPSSDWEKFLEQESVAAFILYADYATPSGELRIDSSKKALAVYQNGVHSKQLRSSTLLKIVTNACRNHLFGAKSQQPFGKEFRDGILTKRDYTSHLQRGKILYRKDTVQEQKVVDSELLLSVMVGEWLVEIFTTWSYGHYFVPDDKKVKYFEKNQIAYDLCVEIHKKHGVCILPALTTFQTLFCNGLMEASTPQDVQDWQTRWNDLSPSAAPRTIPGTAQSSQISSPSNPIYRSSVPSVPINVGTVGGPSQSRAPPQTGLASTALTTSGPSQHHVQLQEAAGPVSSSGTFWPNPAQPDILEAVGGELAGVGSLQRLLQPQGAPGFSDSSNLLPQRSAHQDASAANASTDNTSPHLDGVGLSLPSSSIGPTDSLTTVTPSLRAVRISQPPVRMVPSTSQAPPSLPPRNRGPDSSHPPTPSLSGPITREGEVYEEGHLKFTLNDDQHHKLRDMKMKLLIQGAFCRTTSGNTTSQQRGDGLIVQIKEFIGEYYNNYPKQDLHAAMCKAYRIFAQFYGGQDYHLRDAVKQIIVALDHLRQSSSDRKLDPNSFQFQRLIDDLKLYMYRFEHRHPRLMVLAPNDNELTLLEEMMKTMKLLRGHRQADKGPHMALFEDIIENFTEREMVAQATAM